MRSVPFDIVIDRAACGLDLVYELLSLGELFSHVIDRFLQYESLRAPLAFQPGHDLR